jgi:hypothetical protein
MIERRESTGREIKICDNNVCMSVDGEPTNTLNRGRCRNTDRRMPLYQSCMSLNCVSLHEARLSPSFLHLLPLLSFYFEERLRRELFFLRVPSLRRHNRSLSRWAVEYTRRQLHSKRRSSIRSWQSARHGRVNSDIGAASFHPALGVQL